MVNEIEQKIYDLLEELLHDMEGVEIIYTNHYLTDKGFDSKNHLLMIRDAYYCFCGHERTFELDTSEIVNALEKALPVNVEFDKTLTIKDGKTYKFYITFEEDWTDGW